MQRPHSTEFRAVRTSGRLCACFAATVSIGFFPAAVLGEDKGSRTDFPAASAFNRGTYVAHKLKADIGAGIADETNVSPGHSDVQHIWIQVFENSKKTTVDQTTLFVFCTSSFHGTLTESLVLEKVRLEFVVLDAYGKPSGDTTEVVEIETDYDQNTTKWTWERKSSKGRSIKDFYNGLPQWASLKLHQASGFLSDNPGVPLVSYKPTDIELIFELADAAISFIPRLAKTAIGKTVETAIRRSGKTGLKKAIDDEELHTGADRDITNGRAVKYADDFRRKGMAIWMSL